jgi:hypothetical protein
VGFILPAMRYSTEKDILKAKLERHKYLIDDGNGA